MRILVVEDEKKTAAYLHKGLSESGFVVDVAHQGEDGLHLAMGHDYSFIILDVMLPGRDGWSIIKELRRSGRPTPVLFLTARDAVEERINGLNLGADDYLVKPFSFAELVARIRSILRRSSEPQTESLEVGDLEIHPSHHKAARQGIPLGLTPKEFSLLVLLAKHRGEVLSRTYIAERIWDMNFDCGTNVIDVHVRRLRSKVDDPFESKLIQTVRGVGYVLDENR